ncbi:hypothetical protein L208DRAFT_1393236 [Tricholoma matsutake]|nr:hypothetical protein L208DRAFT_1393236 [Tricholoma matsutake 945]
MDANLTLCVSRTSSGQDYPQPLLVTSPKPTDCPPNHVLIKVDRFGFSANNITYQALGEHPHFRYFDFHPVPETGAISSKTHGLIPVWGFGTVDVSNHPRIHQGEQVYGYFAPTRYLLIPVSSNDVNKHAFYVLRPHLPADRRPYNQVLRCATDPHYIATSTKEDLTMLYRPLFWTSYWCEDWLFSSRYRDASNILISSASAKTAFCLAYLMKKRIARGEINSNVNIIGLTSKKNLAFTNGLGHYHEVFEYDTFTSGMTLQGGQWARWVYVDVAGNKDLNQQVLAHFASPYTGTLVACVSLGFTNIAPSISSASLEWRTNSYSATLAMPPSTVTDTTTSILPFWLKFEHFFMVEWLDVRRHQISNDQIFSRQNQAWRELMTDCIGWVKLDRVYADGVRNAYENVMKNGLGPDEGQIWSLWNKQNLMLSKL